jgi:hypothetical protein
LTFNGLYGIISQKILLFITTVVRTSNRTQNDTTIMETGCEGGTGSIWLRGGSSGRGRGRCEYGNKSSVSINEEQEVGNYLNSLSTTSFSKRILRHGVNIFFSLIQN